MGLKGSSRLRSAAVAGMNCAIPKACLPLRVKGPMAVGRNRLSRQINRTKNSTGSPFACAADSRSRQTDCCVCRDGSDLFVTEALSEVSAASCAVRPVAVSTKTKRTHPIKLNINHSQALILAGLLEGLKN